MAQAGIREGCERVSFDLDVRQSVCTKVNARARDK